MLKQLMSRMTNGDEDCLPALVDCAMEEGSPLLQAFLWMQKAGAWPHHAGTSFWLYSGVVSLHDPRPAAAFVPEEVAGRFFPPFRYGRHWPSFESCVDSLRRAVDGLSTAEVAGGQAAAGPVATRPGKAAPKELG